MPNSEKPVTANVPSEPVYRIGAVSRLTGIATVTIRMWERRYGVVEPNRTEGRNRLYTREDIARLALIKRLVDEGNAIGTVANLSLQQLQERLQFRAAPSAGNSETRRVVVLGDALPARVGQGGPELRGLSIVGVFRNPQQFREEAAALRPEVLVVEYPTIHEDTLEEIDALMDSCGARQGVVVYGFGRQAAVKHLDTARLCPLRAPVGLGDLRRACVTDLGHENLMPQSLEPVPTPPADTIPPRRYSGESLARLASISTAVHCECPHHLAELLFSLNAFEKYSQECRHRNPEDAALHAYLHITTARARSMMEEALARVVEMEGLEQ